MTHAVRSMPALVVEGLHAGYGRMQVVSDVSFELHAGELMCMVGRNGAGKSTSLAAIAGKRFSPPVGRIRLGEVDLSRATPADAYRHGIALVPEGHRVFGELTVEENLLIGRHARRRVGEAQLETVYGLFPILKEFAKRDAGRLSGGQQQMVAIGQAFMGDPSVLLLDEPSSGLAPAVVTDIYKAVLSMRHAGKAILVVEQSLERALAYAEQVLVMEGGHVVLRGPASELATTSQVAEIVRGTGVSKHT